MLLLAGGAAAGEPAAAALAPPPYDRVLGHDELTALLSSWARARPGLMNLESIGRTPEGRELWLVTVTERATGPAQDKPALLVDGGMHAIEWIGGTAALDFLWTLLRDEGRDTKIARLLATRSVYLVPRLSPDGVEATLAAPRVLRSAIRPAPGEPPMSGLRMSDVDGDGRITFMRLRDPRGAWQAHVDDARLLVPRPPDSGPGDYWRVVPEGRIDGYDGATIPVVPALEGVDFGMFFPDDRAPVPAGGVVEPDAARVPEVAAYVAAIRARPNIVAHVTGHSFGGAILVPPVNAGESMPELDRERYAALGGEGARRLGYDYLSYLELRAGQRLDTHIPTDIGWFYNRLGILSFVTEFWNPLKAAGVTYEGRMSRWLGGHHPADDDLTLLRFSDRELAGAGFVAWRPFPHPELGAVEIGGWDKVHAWYNPPFARVEREIAPHAGWLADLALSLPELGVRSFTAVPAGMGLWRLRLVVENTGWLPTSGSQRAIDASATGRIVAELSLPAGATVADGQPRRELAHLAGRSEQRSLSTWWGYQPGTPDRAVVEWVVAARAGATIDATVHHPRAGRARARVRLQR